MSKALHRLPCELGFLLLSRLVKFLGSYQNGTYKRSFNPIITHQGTEATVLASHCLTRLKCLLHF